MSATEKWDQRFRSATEPNTPAHVLSANTHLLPANGRALEIACGLGGNALLLAEHGLGVEALDVSPVALAKLKGFAEQRGLQIDARQADLEAGELIAQHYDVIVCSHYLYRPLCAALQNALNEGGLLFYQTFTRDKLEPVGPSREDYLLQRNELTKLFAGLDVIYYREDGRHGNTSQGLRNVACFIGTPAPR